MTAGKRFGTWLRTTRQSRGLTQRQLPLPAGTIAAYESGRRIPKTFQQRRRLAEALHISLEALYAVLEDAGAVADTDMYHLIQTQQWEAAYQAWQQEQSVGYEAGNSRMLAETEHWASVLAAQQPLVTLTSTMGVDNPLQALEWASAALRSNQWVSAWGVLEAVARDLPADSPAWGRLYHTLAITLQALGRLEDVLEWDARYIVWAQRQQSAWQCITAHALALAHSVRHDPQSAEIADHIAVLQRWRTVDHNQPDPLVTCWMLDAQLRVALAHRQTARARQMLQEYARCLRCPNCHGERWHFTELQAQLLALEGDPKAGARRLRAALRDPADRPAYQRLEATQTLARLTGQVSIWRQLIQAYWALGAHAWIARLLPEWQRADPQATLEHPPVFLPDTEG